MFHVMVPMSPSLCAVIDLVDLTVLTWHIYVAREGTELCVVSLCKAVELVGINKANLCCLRTDIFIVVTGGYPCIQR